MAPKKKLKKPATKKAAPKKKKAAKKSMKAMKSKAAPKRVAKAKATAKPKKAVAAKPAPKKRAAPKASAPKAALPSAGRFIWHELSTQDVGSEISFYTGLFGWTTSEMPGSGGQYTLFKSGETNVGGITSMGPPGPTHWNLYCSVDDVDAAVARAIELGGNVVAPANDYPGVGRFAAVADPQGAVLWPMKDANPTPETMGRPAPGTWCWDECFTSDPAAAADFYKAIYGWTITPQDMGPMGTYYLLKRGDQMAGGIFKGSTPGVPSHWYSHVAVTDLDATVAKAPELGGRVVMAPTPVPGMGRFAVILDPAGADFAVFQGG